MSSHNACKPLLSPYVHLPSRSTAVKIHKSNSSVSVLCANTGHAPPNPAKCLLWARKAKWRAGFWNLPLKNGIGPCVIMMISPLPPPSFSSLSFFFNKNLMQPVLLYFSLHPHLCLFVFFHPEMVEQAHKRGLKGKRVLSQTGHISAPLRKVPFPTLWPGISWSQNSSYSEWSE